MPGPTRPNLSGLPLGGDVISRQGPVSMFAPPDPINVAQYQIVQHWRDTFTFINKEIAVGNAETLPYRVKMSVVVGGVRRELLTQMKIGYMVPTGLPMPVNIQGVPGLLRIPEGGPVVVAIDIKRMLAPVVQIADPASGTWLTVGLLFPGEVCDPVPGNFGCTVDADGYLRFENASPINGLPMDQYFATLNITTTFTNEVAYVEFQTPIEQADDRVRFEIESFAVREIWDTFSDRIDTSIANMNTYAAAAGLAGQ